MFISQKHLPRRTVLRGLGASLALPLLDGMVPAYAALRKTAANPVRRLGVCYVPKRDGDAGLDAGWRRA